MKTLLKHIFLSAIAIGATAIFCIVPSGCKPRTLSTGIHTSTSAGRVIRANLDGPGFVQLKGDSAIVSTRANKITIERERVLIDGTELAKLPAAATEVEVTVAAGQLTVTADGAAITTKLPIKSLGSVFAP